MKRHINEFVKTSFANNGRAAGSGILYDRYDEESGRGVPSPSYSPKAKLEMYSQEEWEEHTKPSEVTIRRVHNAK